MALNSTVSRLNWNLEMLVFAEGGKPPEQGCLSIDDIEYLVLVFVPHT